jgi:hypothetical protein
MDLVDGQCGMGMGGDEGTRHLPSYTPSQWVAGYHCAVPATAHHKAAIVVLAASARLVLHSLFHSGLG